MCWTALLNCKFSGFMWWTAQWLTGMHLNLNQEIHNLFFFEKWLTIIGKNAKLIVLFIVASESYIGTIVPSKMAASKQQRFALISLPWILCAVASPCCFLHQTCTHTHILSHCACCLHTSVNHRSVLAVRQSSYTPVIVVSSVVSATDHNTLHIPVNDVLMLYVFSPVGACSRAFQYMCYNSPSFWLPLACFEAFSELYLQFKSAFLPLIEFLSDFHLVSWSCFSCRPEVSFSNEHQLILSTAYQCSNVREGCWLAARSHVVVSSQVKPLKNLNSSRSYERE